MSLATLKKKTQTKYNNMSVNSVFNLNGTTRNQGYIGQTSLSRSLPKTIMKGPIMHGYGTCCIKLPLNKPIISGIDYNNDFRVIKTSVKNTKGMLADRKVRYLNSNNESKSQVVKEDSNNNNSTQVDFINSKKQTTIIEADSSMCQPYVYQTDCNDCKFDTELPVSCDNACHTQLNKPRRYKFISPKALNETVTTTQDVTTMSQSKYLENMRKNCYTVDLINRFKTTNTMNIPLGC